MARRQLAGVLLSLSLLAIRSNLSFARPGAGPETLYLNGQVTNDSNQPIPGASCTLIGPLLPGAGITATTDAEGKFQLAVAVSGSYTLTCAAVGFKPISKNQLQINEGEASFVQMALPGEEVMKQQVEVHAQAPEVSAQSNIAAPAVITAKQLTALPLVEQKFKAALPIIPGVVRTPDGKTNIKGVEEAQGLLLVDGAETVDPVTGSFSIEIPIDAVQSLEVYKTAYPAEYGRFSGGLTTIETKPPANQFHFELHDFLPTPRVEGGKVSGIMDDEPRLYLTGPLLSDKLNVSESFEYDFIRQDVRGLAFPNNETTTYGYNSYTSLQYIASSNNLVTFDTDIFPKRQEFANINSLVPQTASSNYGQKGFSSGVTDHYLFPSGAVLTSLFQFTKFDSNAYGQGPLDMLVTPNGWGGNFFNAFNRSTDQEELSENYQFARMNLGGRHDLTVGAEYVRRAYTGTSASRPVMIQRPDGTLAEQIDFTGPAVLSAIDNEAAVFIQDHYTMNRQLAFDAGLRFSSQTVGEPAAFSPRFGAVYTPFENGKTIIHAGVGVFYDRLPLLATDFTENPTRTVSLFDPLGMLLGSPVTYQNDYLKTEENGAVIVPSRHRLDSTPYNTTWNVEGDQELAPHLVLKVSYLASQTVNDFVVNPVVLENRPTLLMSNTGSSTYHEFDTQLHYQPNEKVEVNTAYIHSLARGDLNTLGQIYIPFEQPVIRPDVYANLPSDIPNRFVGWGTVRFPAGFGASPILDIHTGYPYSAIEVLQNYVGTPNSLRLPDFTSLDVQFTKDFSLPFLPSLKNHRFRAAFIVYNLFNHFNPRDVYNNTTSPYFQHYVGCQHIFFDAYFDILD